jgi:type II secretion system protein L
LLPDGVLPLLAAQIPVSKPINLLQGAYAAPSSFGTRLQQWRLPAALAAATLVVFIGSHALQLWKLHKAEQQLDAQLTQAFHQVLPGQPIVDARSQIQGVIARAGGGQGAMLPAVSMVAQAIAQAPATHLEGLSYRSGTLELHVVAPNVEALDGLQQAMKRNGARVELLSANQRDRAYEGRLQVRLGAA